MEHCSDLHSDFCLVGSSFNVFVWSHTFQTGPNSVYTKKSRIEM